MSRSVVISIVCFALGALPLIIWPVVAVASIMGFAGEIPEGTPWIDLVIPKLFFLATMLYPVVYIGAMVLFFTFMASSPTVPETQKIRRKDCILLLLSLLPLLFLIMTVLLGYLFFLTSV